MLLFSLFINLFLKFIVSIHENESLALNNLWRNFILFKYFIAGLLWNSLFIINKKICSFEKEKD